MPYAADQILHARADQLDMYIRLIFPIYPRGGHLSSLPQNRIMSMLDDILSSSNPIRRDKHVVTARCV